MNYLESLLSQRFKKKLRNLLNYKHNQEKMPVIDLKFDYASNPKKTGRGTIPDAHRQTDFFLSYGLLADAYFRQCVNRYQGNRKPKKFSCLDHFLCMAFAQLTYRESLLDLRGKIPTFIHISDEKIQDIKVL